jgi:predicted lipoprotein with Yx(FWY)xxD motif
MRHPRIVAGALGIAAVAAVGGVAAAATTGSSGKAAPSGNASQSAAPVHTASVTVGGTSENVLVDAHGDPLYYYQADTPTTSMVSGHLAALWPPVTSTASPASLAGGQVTAVTDSHGSQAAFNGHLLYTFVSDQPGTATGQGVAHFFLATPGLSPAAGSAPAPAPSTDSSGGGGGYSY